MSYYPVFTGSRTGFNPAGNQLTTYSSGRGPRGPLRGNPFPYRPAGPPVRPPRFVPGPQVPPPATSGNFYLANNHTMTRGKGKFRKRRRGVIKKRIPRAVQPYQKVVKGVIADTQNFACGSGAINALIVSHNALCDPIRGASTNQFLGYDQWKVLYERAIVIGTKLTAIFHNAGTQEPVYVGITKFYPNEGTSALADYEHYVEHANTKYRLISQDVDHCRIFNKASTKKMFHLKNLKDNKEDYSVSLNTEANPTDQCYYHVWAQPHDKTTTTGVDVHIKLEAIILLYDPILPDRSTATTSLQ